MNNEKKYAKWFLFLFLVILVTAGAFFFFWKKDHPSTQSYREVPVSRGNIEVTILSTGVVSPYNRLEIKPPVSGRMENVLVEEGEKVKKGQILGWMSSTERAVLLDAARAKGPEELKRWEEFYKATPIVAPLDGMLILRNVQPGQTVTNQDAILVLSDRLIVKAQVDETDIAKVKLKQNARITLDAYPDQIIPGQVDHIVYEAKIVNNVTTYEVDVIPNKPPDFLRSGQTANTTFIVAQKENVPFLSSDAVQQKGKQAMVLLPSSKGSPPIPHPIEVGLNDGKKVEILSGLDEGEKVLVPSIRPSHSSSSSSSGQTNPFSPYGRKK
jgi:macrolide-specific efflux system membrane fusion protein